MTDAAPPLLVAMAGGKPRLRGARIPVPKESKLHVLVADLLRDHCLPDWRWRFLNSKARDAREGAIFKTMGVSRGWPDFILVSPFGSVRFLELKRLGEEPSDDQREFRVWCLRCGVPHVVAWTMDQVHEAFMNWGCLRIRIPPRRRDGGCGGQGR
jgi:hypothetical protein